MRDPTLGNRMFLWKTTLRMIHDHPILGTGGLTWPWMFPKYRSESDSGLQGLPVYAHNDILQATSDYGIVGAVLLVAVMVCFFWHVVMVNRHRTSSDERSFAIGAAVGVTAILVHSWSDFNLHIGANALLLAAIMGFTAAIDTGERRFKREDLRPAGRYVLATALVALALAAIWFVAPTCRAARYTALGNGAKEEIEWDQAETYYRHAIALDPKSWEPYARLGDVYSSKALFRDRARPDERKELVQVAVSNYNTALALNPFHSELMVRQARTHQIVGENEQALKLFERALQVDPNDAFIFASLGRYYRQLGDDKKAADAFLRSLKLNAWGDPTPRLNWEELQNPAQQ